jgi:acyl-[acyl-carrier-protein] desaturase
VVYHYAFLNGGERGDEISSWKSQRTTWPQFVDKGKYSKMPKLSVQAQMEEFFYRELVKYLKLAEEKRRWNVFKDIHWDAANPESSETLAQCVETFCAVEMYLPDFTSKMLNMIRRSRGRAWFHVNWGLRRIEALAGARSVAARLGHRTEDQRQEVEKELSEAEWELPFDHPRQMTCYTMIQELATFWNYRNLEKMAVQQKDRALTGALRLISSTTRALQLLSQRRQRVDEARRPRHR